MSEHPAVLHLAVEQLLAQHRREIENRLCDVLEIDADGPISLGPETACTLCEQDVPERLWLAVGDPGMHWVLVAGELELSTDPAVDVSRYVIHATCDARLQTCRSYRAGLAGPG